MSHSLQRLYLIHPVLPCIETTSCTVNPGFIFGLMLKPLQGAGEALKLAVWHAVQVADGGEELVVRAGKPEWLPLLATVHGVQLRLVVPDEF